MQRCLRRAVTRIAGLAGIAAVVMSPALASETVFIPASDGGQSLRAYYSIPETPGRHPAVVFLHGCGGLGSGGQPRATYRAWEEILLDAGYAVLMVDSAGSRGFGSTCGGEGRKAMYQERPGDAYAALAYLQSRPEIDPAGVSLIGWSQGGGIVLLTVSAKSIGRPVPPPARDFRSAIAFYPAACSKRLQTKPFTDVDPDDWSTVMPLLVLQGGADNWTLAAPCVTFIESLQARGEPAEIVVYPGAVHSFDAPGIPVHEREGLKTPSGAAPLLGTDEAARAAAIERVLMFLKQPRG